VLTALSTVRPQRNGVTSLPDLEWRLHANDLVLFGVKLWDTLEAAEASKPLLGASTAVASFQNGVVRDDILRQTMGAEHVIGGVCAQGVSLPAGYADERLAFTDQVPATMTSSMHHDLENGNRLEVPWLSGDVVERGARLGAPTPCNRAIFDILSIYSEGCAVESAR
jgi:ketopantoate reductase